MAPGADEPAPGAGANYKRAPAARNTDIPSDVSARHDWPDLMTRFKALSMIQARAYVQEEYGDAGVARLKAQLSRETRDAIYSETLLPTDWLELDRCVDWTVALDEVLGTGDLTTCAEMTRNITINHFSALYRPILTGTTPNEMLVKTSRLWTRYYDRGESIVEFPAANHALKRILHAPDLPLHHQVFLVPYYEELLRLCGAREPHARHVQCVALGAEECVTEIKWKD